MCPPAPRQLNSKHPVCLFCIKKEIKVLAEQFGIKHNIIAIAIKSSNLYKNWGVKKWHIEDLWSFKVIVLVSFVRLAYKLKTGVSS